MSADPGYSLVQGKSNWSTQRAVSDGYRASHWVYSAVRRISQAASSVPWTAVEGSGDDREDLPDHELTKLLAKPNEYASGQDLIERIAGHLYLGGNAILVKARDQRGRVRELWPIMPDRVYPALDNAGYLRGYKWTSKDGEQLPPLSPKDVTHLQFIDPANDWWGMSPLQAAARIVDTDVDAVRWNRIALQNRAVPDGVLSTDQQLENAQYDRMQEQMRSKTAREMLILEAGLSWQQLSLSPAEMDFVESRKMSREDILSVFGVPPAMVGIVQSATQSDVEAMRLQFWLDTIIPFLRDVESALNLSLAPEFGADISVRYDTSDIEALQASFDKKTEWGQRLFAMGFTRKEINRVLELGMSEEEMVEPDTAYLPANLVPLNGEIVDAEPIEEPPPLRAVESGPLG